MAPPDHRLDLPSGLRQGSGRHIGQLFDCFSPAERAVIFEISVLKTIRAGETVIGAGAQSGHLGYIVNGILCMKKVLADGRSHIIGFLTRGGMFGRILDGEAGYSVEALTDTEVFCLERAPFEHILRGNPAVERAFLVNVLDELDAARASILMLGGRKVPERVAAFLLLLTRSNSEIEDGTGQPPVIVRVPVRRAEWAQYLGTRPETLSRALHSLETRAVIRIIDPYCFEIVDRAALAGIAGQD